MATILITGGSGLIGSHLTRALLKAGHTVRHLSRTPGNIDGVQVFTWDIRQGTMDRAALEGADHIVHLAGAGIADKRWTDARVKVLIESRTRTAGLLLRTARELGIKPRSFVSAAGINYYGAVTSEHVFTEDDPPGDDTIGRISREWEAAVDAWSDRCRVVKLRTPPVLAPNGGALPKIALPARLGLASPIGSGDQWWTWVHIDDLVAAYVKALEDTSMQGAYNVCAPEQPDNRTYMRTLAQVLGRPFFLPPVPGFLLRLVLGEVADALLKGSRASILRLKSTGFTFRHPELQGALADCLRKDQ